MRSRYAYYHSELQHGTPIDNDPYFTLMADQYGDGFVLCGDGVLVVPLTDDGHVLMAIERSPAFDAEVLVLVGGEVEEGEPLEETANRELQEELGQDPRCYVCACSSVAVPGRKLALSPAFRCSTYHPTPL